MPTPILFATKDNAEGQLAAGINASVTTITVGAGEGAEFPQPYRGTASSTGSGTVLNDTGDLGSVAQYKVIRNVTDGSWAVVTTTGTDSVTTTRLRGGSDNTWQSGDEWRVDEFIVFLEEVTGSVVTKREKALIINRSTDTLTVATGGRGYDGSTAQSFSTSDYVRLHVASKTVEEIIMAITDLDIAENTLNTSMTTAQTDIIGLQSGSSHYAVATGSSNAYAASYADVDGPIAAGMVFAFKANFANTGSCTLTVTLNASAQSAKTIKKKDGATNLASGDIANGQLVLVRYDGTNLQMLSPVANTSTIIAEDVDLIYSQTGSSASPDSVNNTASQTDFTKKKTCAANFFSAAGSRARIIAFGATRSKASSAGTVTIRIYYKGQGIAAIVATMTDNQDYQAWRIEAEVICNATGASARLYCVSRGRYEGASTKDSYGHGYDQRDSTSNTIVVDDTASGDLKVSVTFSVADTANYCDLAALIIEQIEDIN